MERVSSAHRMWMGLFLAVDPFILTTTTDGTAMLHPICDTLFFFHSAVIFTVSLDAHSSSVKEARQKLFLPFWIWKPRLRERTKMAF